LHSAAVFYRHATAVRPVEWLTWRGATWCYVAYLAVIVFARRRGDIAMLALVATIAATQLNVLVNNPNQLVRYMTAPTLLGILLLPLLFTRPAPAPPPSSDASGTS
jgi:hypothetical protein